MRRAWGETTGSSAGSGQWISLTPAGGHWLTARGTKAQSTQLREAHHLLVLHQSAVQDQQTESAGDGVASPDRERGTLGKVTPGSGTPRADDRSYPPRVPRPVSAVGPAHGVRTEGWITVVAAVQGG